MWYPFLNIMTERTSAYIVPDENIKFLYPAVLKTYEINRECARRKTPLMDSNL
jgi:hypothetical protein